MSSLHNSIHAPASQRRPEPAKPAATPQERRIISRKDEFQRFCKLLRRLYWRGHHLLVSQQQAMIHRNGVQNGATVFTHDAKEAEIMFKVDFFEFYVLLERAIVHLLRVFGIEVSSSLSSQDTQPNNPLNLPHREASTRNQLIGDSTSFQNQYGHRFHANVLEALDTPSSPLHCVLGTGDVRAYIGIAKEFRNRWKDVQDVESAGDEREMIGLRRYQQRLQDLKLEAMLDSILTALQHAKQIGEVEYSKFASTEGAVVDMDIEMTVAPWEAMPDAMDYSL